MSPMLYHLKNTVFYLILFVLFNSCNGQSKRLESCQTSYKNAKLQLGKYIQTNNKSLIEDAIKHLDTSMECKETKYKSIELKISLLSILKQYKNAYVFIDSLKDDDFSREYKRKMQSNFFRALQYESESDTINRNQLLKEIIVSIQTYIQKMPNGKIDEEAYYDLFFIKYKILNKQQIDKELDSLKKQYPSKRDFFDILKESVDDETKESYPILSE